MRDEILAVLNTAIKSILELVKPYGHSVNEGPDGFIELKIGSLELVQVSFHETKWRIVCVCYAQTLSTCSLRRIDCSKEQLIDYFQIETKRAFHDFSLHHEVWKKIGIV